VVSFVDSRISRRIFPSIEGSAQVGKRENVDEVQVAALKLIQQNNFIMGV
jgi:hypothetical protein